MVETVNFLVCCALLFEAQSVSERLHHVHMQIYRQSKAIWKQMECEGRPAKPNDKDRIRIYTLEYTFLFHFLFIS